MGQDSAAADLPGGRKQYNNWSTELNLTKYEKCQERHLFVMKNSNSFHAWYMLFCSCFRKFPVNHSAELIELPTYVCFSS